MFQNILIVCVGNICRSPALERLLTHYGVEAEVRSAGLGALQGKGIDKQMVSVLSDAGVNWDGHIARQLDASMIKSADLVLVMENEHLRSVRELDPPSAGKVMLAGHWVEGLEIADPYRKSDEMFAICYKQLDECAQAWASKL